MSHVQMALDFTPPPDIGRHIGPLGQDDGDGCDCCAQRLRCAICGERFLARRYAYYYREDTRDLNGYAIGLSGTYEDLPGPCCIPEDHAAFGAFEEEDYPRNTGRLVRRGQYVYGAWGVIRARLWVPVDWPMGESPWRRQCRESQASRVRRRRT